MNNISNSLLKNDVIKVIEKINQSACPSPEEYPCEESHKNRPKYLCVYCTNDQQTLSEVIKHCIEHHGDKPLKYREFAFDPVLTNTVINQSCMKVLSHQK